MKDLQTFIHLFNSDRIKTVGTGLEVRANNLDYELENARAIINGNQLGLIAHCVGDQSGYRAFTVSIV
jgi:hypothetical protein